MEAKRGSRTSLENTHVASALRESAPTPSIVVSASTGYTIAPALASRDDLSLTQTMSADVACRSFPLPQLNNQ